MFCVVRTSSCQICELPVTHYGEQNGDLMRDPEMCFEIRDGELDPYFYRNDYVGVEQGAETLYVVST